VSPRPSIVRARARRIDDVAHAERLLADAIRELNASPPLGYDRLDGAHYRMGAAEQCIRNALHVLERLK
jgi:hypothetical protein